MKKIFYILPLLVLSCSKTQSIPDVVKTEIAEQNNLMDAGSIVSENNGPCPNDMVEINGNHCSVPGHHCIEGGKDNFFKDAKEPMPYYCNEYKEEKIKCLGKQTKLHFCIDRFEFPNIIGEKPRVFTSYYDAEKQCKNLGKRLCLDVEWELACMGPDWLPYPTGFKRDNKACNIDHPWIKPNDGILKNGTEEEIKAELERLYQGHSIGDRLTCKSAYGVYDLTGNVDEMTTNYSHNNKPYRLSYKGGHWVGGARNRCLPATLSHDESTKYYCEGWRCCKSI